MRAALCIVALLSAGPVWPEEDGLTDDVIETLSDAPARDASEDGAPPEVTPYPQTTTVFEIATGTADQTTGAAEAVSDILSSIGRCWLPPEGAPAVVVGFEMTPEGRVVEESISLLATDRDAGELVEQTYRAARRAILRCQGSGFELAPEDYELWRDIEITFDAWDPLQ